MTAKFDDAEKPKRHHRAMPEDPRLLAKAMSGVADKKIQSSTDDIVERLTREAHPTNISPGARAKASRLLKQMERTR